MRNTWKIAPCAAGVALAGLLALGGASAVVRRRKNQTGNGTSK